MWPFRSKQPSHGPAPATVYDAKIPNIPLHFDKMLKGSIVQRKTGKVRQFGVIVDGTLRVVTSGEYVDQETYAALAEQGVVPPLGATWQSQDASNTEPRTPSAPAVGDHATPPAPELSSEA